MHGIGVSSEMMREEIEPLDASDQVQRGGDTTLVFIRTYSPILPD